MKAKMKRLTTLCVLCFALLFFRFLDVDCYTYASSPLFKSLPELAADQQSSSKHFLTDRFFLNAVVVTCGEASIEVRVKADLFGTGFPVRADELAVLSAGSDGESCRAWEAGEAEYKIKVPFDKCGTDLWINDETLIYTNILLYSPAPLSRGMLRMRPAAIPIQCHYSRRYKMSSEALVPTWSPLNATVSQQSDLKLNIKLLSSDWSSELMHGAYYLGDLINVEASVDAASQLPLRVYVDSCVATQAPDVATDPRYFFIHNHGCLIDSLLTGSSSYFLPRVQDNRLRFQLEAFRFHNTHSNLIFITCFLEAVPIAQRHSGKRACSYIDGRWRSADGNDQVCLSCNRDYSAQDVTQPLLSNQPVKQNGQKITKRQSDEHRALFEWLNLDTALRHSACPIKVFTSSVSLSYSFESEKKALLANYVPVMHMVSRLCSINQIHMKNI